MPDTASLASGEVEQTPVLKGLLDAFVPTGSRCLHVGHHSSGAPPGHGCGCVHADVSETTALPFEGESFDAALLINLLDRLVDPRLAAAELCRVLRPGGVLLVTAPNPSYWRHRLTRTLRGRDRAAGAFSPAAVRSLLLDGGFSLVGVEGQGGSSRPVRIAARLAPSLLGSQVGAFAIKGATS